MNIKLSLVFLIIIQTSIAHSSSAVCSPSRYSLYPEKVIELGQLLNKYIANGRSTPGIQQMNNVEVPLFTIAIAGKEKIADTLTRKKELDNLFYCQNTLGGFENYPKTPFHKAKLIKEIGFDGLEGSGYDGFFELKDAIEGQGLSMPVNYVPIKFQDDGELDDVSINEIKSMIKATTKEGLIYFSISHKADKDKTDSEDKIIASALRKLADFASIYEVKLCSYPHVNTYCETISHSVTLAKLVDRKNFGAALNLCHLLKVEGPEGLQNKIEEFTPYLFAVNICGADDGDTRQYGWNRLIQPLGEGSFDTYNFVKLLRDNGYTGPIGLQCYNLKGDVVKTLTQSMNTWKDYKKRYAKGK